MAGRLNLDPSSVTSSSNEEKGALLARYFNRVKFVSVAENSLYFRVVRAYPSAADPKGEMPGLNPFYYFPGGFLSLHDSSPMRFHSTPQTEVAREGSVIWVSFGGAFLSGEGSKRPIPVIVMMYWSGTGSRWIVAKAFIECKRARSWRKIDSNHLFLKITNQNLP